ncbi:MAG: hypothetical protein Q7R46_00710 [bacterium]|nr:hypothetical protein [bacterium]
MVREIKKEDKTLYQCQECGFEYKEKEWAEKCEAWCKNTKSCNLEIIKHAVDKGREINN